MAETLMAAEMAEQPAVLKRLIEHFDSNVARIRTGDPRPTGRSCVCCTRVF